MIGSWSRTSDMRAHRYRVKGRVQGVGFRYFTYQTARSLEVMGWVRNLSSGDVEIHVEGNDESVSTFQSRIESGTMLARVDEVEVKPIAAENLEDFSIRQSHLDR